MTKKHFIRLAEYIRDSQKYAGVAFTDAQINHLADFCHEANPRFNRERWIGYIKGENGKNGGSLCLQRRLAQWRRNRERLLQLLCCQRSPTH